MQKDLPKHLQYKREESKTKNKTVLSNITLTLKH